MSSNTAASNVSTPSSGASTASNSSTPTPTASTPAPATTGSTNSTGNSTQQSSASTPAQAPAPATLPAGNPPPPAPPPPPTSGGGTSPDLQPTVYNSFDQSQLQVDKNTGALDTTYPITIPPGRNGLQPDVDLVYNSQNMQQGSIFGEGWAINIPYIERLNKIGSDSLYSTSTLNYFTSSLDGEIVSTTTVSSTGVTYVARTDNGTFNKYTFSSSTDSWTMTDKNGTQYVFGSTSSSQQNDPNNSAHVYKWMLSQITDTNNNNVTYNYFKDSGQIYPSSTFYTGNGSSTGIFEIDFQLASSTDNATSSATGFAVNSNYRVSQILAKVNGTWVRKYVLSYAPGDNGYTALLSSIAESGENASGTVVSLPSSTFAYQVQTPGWTNSSTWNPPIPFVTSTYADDGVWIANLTGNGLPGLISSSSAWVDIGNTWQSSSTWISPVPFTTANGGDNGYRVVDVNGDGLPDIISCNGSYLNTGAGWQIASTTWNSPICFATGGTSAGAILADVNGDGLPAILSGPSNKRFQVDTNGTLTTDLQSYYKLEDPTDFWNTNNLTNNGSSTVFDPGKVNNGADFGTNNTSSILETTSSLGINGGVMSMACWVNINTEPGNYTLAIQGNNSSKVLYYLQYYDDAGTSRLNFTRYPLGNTSGYGTVDLPYNLTAGTWYFLVGTYDGTNVNLYVNNVSQGSSASSGSGTTSFTTGSSIGGDDTGTQIDSPFASEKADECGVWSKVLSAQEMTDLYNGGNGETMIGTTTSTATVAYLDTGTGWATSTVWAPPVQFVTSGGLDNGVRIADVNGDGLPDILQGYTDASGTAHYDSYLNTGDGWATSTIWDPPVPFTGSGGWDKGFRVTDVNGDGLPDIISGSSTKSFQVDTNGTLTTDLQSYYKLEDPTDFWGFNNLTSSGSVTFDTGKVNNAADFGSSNTSNMLDTESNLGIDGGTMSMACWININSAPGNYTLAIQGNNSSKVLYYLQYYNAAGTMRLNFTRYPLGNNTGYGTVDLPYTLTPGTWYFLVGTYDGTNVNLYVNNVSQGSSASSGSGSTSFTTGFSIGGDDTGTQTDSPYASEKADECGVWSKALSTQEMTDLYNSDNGQTMVVANTSTNPGGYLDTGNGWATSTAWRSPTVFDQGGGYDQGSRLADVGGEGLPDIIQGFTDSAGLNHYAAWTNDNTVRADLLTNITYPQGGSSTIQYKAATQSFNASGTVANNVPYPVYIVSKITTGDGLGNTASSLGYQYSGGTYYVNGAFDHQFAGFQVVTQTDAAGNVTKTYYDTSNGVSSSTGQYQDNFWKIGKPYRVENYDNAGHLYKLTITKWDSTSTGGNAAFVFPDQTLEMDYDGLSTHNDSGESYSWNLKNGNQTQMIQWGQVTGSSTGSFATSTNGYTTNLTYASSTGSNVIGKVSDEILLNQSSTKIQETQYFYDNLALGSVSTTGNLTTQDDWISGSTYATTTRNTYNSYGLVTQTLDPRNNTTTYTYDTYNLYTATTTNALGQTANDQYDYSTGKVTQAIDPNGNPSQTVYDGLGRTLFVLPSNPASPTTVATKTAYIYTDTADAVSVEEIDYLTATTTVNSYSYYDGLGRAIQTRKMAEDSGIYKVTDETYNNVGLTQQQSLPYFATGSAKTSATTTAALFTNYAYDALQRVLTIGNAVGTTTNSYANWEVETIDPRGKEKDTFDDAFGNLVQVNEHNGSSTYSTYYTYDGLKDLTSITDALGNVRNFTYDGLGRRLTAQDLHAPSDATYGTWNYTFDNAGNLTQQVDPKNQTTTYSYDSLNRVTAETFSGQTQIAYTYDTCSNGVGLLCVASSSAAVTTSTYDSDGRLLDETKTIGTSTYTTGYTYDFQGDVTNITNPDNSVVHYDFGAGGLIEDVTYKPSGGSTTNIINSMDYAPTDQLATISYANGVNATNTYDAAHLYRLTQKLSTLPSSGGNAQNISYSYDADGNITQIVDTGNSGAGRTVNYAYDDLDRLIDASTTNVSSSPSYNQAFTYNAIGDILTGPEGTYSYNGNTGSNYADPDAVTGIFLSGATTTFTYDNDGNLINPGTATDTWNYRNQLTQSVNASGTLTYAYDYTGARVSVANGSTTTYYPEVTYSANSAARTKNIFANGLLLATIQDSTSTVVAATSTISFIQAISNNATTTITTTTVSGVGAGDLLLAEFTYTGSATTSPLTDDAGTPVFITSSTWNTTAHSYLYYEKSANAGTHHFHTSYGGIPSFPGVFITEYSGASTSSPLDKFSVATGTGGSMFSPTMTSTIVNEMAFGFGNAAGQTLSAGTGFSLRGTQHDIEDNATSTMVAGGSVSTTFSGAGSASWVVQGALISPVAGGATSTIATTTVSYVLSDQLGGTNVVTNVSGSVVETLDYYPYGGVRIDSAPSQSQRKFTGQILDESTGLTYDNARYYNGAQGQFISQDPMFLGIPNQQHLNDPQSLNAYSYSEDNPIVKSDTTGKDFGLDDAAEAILIAGFVNAGISIYGQAASDYSTGAYEQRGLWGNVETYTTVGLSGFAVGAATAYVGVEAAAAKYGADAIFLLTGGTAATVDTATTLASDAILKRPVNPGAIAVGAGVDLLTAGGFDLGEAEFGSTEEFTNPESPQFNVGEYTAVQTVNGVLSNKVQSAAQSSYNSNSGGSHGSGVSTEENPSEEYTFNGLKNAYGQTYSQVFGTK